jgi:death on curing protein
VRSEPSWLLIHVVIAIHEALIAEHGGPAGIRDRGLLESTLARPRNLLAYSEDASLFDLAASYAYGLARNHCFVDGNKRVAFTAALTFLSLHGIRLEASQEEKYLIFLRLAEGEVTEAELSAWLEAHSRRMD